MPSYIAYNFANYKISDIVTTRHERFPPRKISGLYELMLECVNLFVVVRRNGAYESVTDMMAALGLYGRR